MSSSQDARHAGRRIDPDVETATNIKERIKERAEELVEQGQEAVENLGERVRGQVTARPLASLLAAGGIGLLLGMLIARKR